jgi:HEAT repeat protein
MSRSPGTHDYDGWVAQLGSSTRRQRARQHLLESGPPAVPAIRRGLRHRDATVRRLCVNLLDHLVDDDAIPDLVAALDDDDPEVLGRALHALACDRCKQNACRPGDELFVPRALELVRDHPNPDVRAAAIDALGRAAQRNPDVAAALEYASEHEPNAGLRSMARRRTERAKAISS